ncbi:MAG: SDR family oxidoreductase [bacterium]|nr:SDR family oxidoreductase [bacterium]
MSKFEDIEYADLPTQPQPDIGTVLVAGATGYIGGRLLPALVMRGYRVRAMVRAGSLSPGSLSSEVEVVVADALDAEQVYEALEGVHTAYYLIHSMLYGLDKFENVDIQAAINFRRAAEARGVKRIIYLGGLGDIRTSLPSHLCSRRQVGNQFSESSVPTTILRAAIIIGSGSASYEMINHLVRRLPILLTPKWIKTRCQPIAIRDVLKYLIGVLEHPETIGRTFDIGGDDVLTYREILATHSALLGRKQLLIRSPAVPIGFYSYIASLLTPVPASISRCLMDSMTHDVVCQERDIVKLIPFRRLAYKEALVLAISRVEQDAVRTRWSDNYPPDHELAIKLHELESDPNYRSSHSLVSRKSPAALFRSVIKIGGREGWFHSNALWRIRGAFDRMLLGVGTARGRRSESTLRRNDVIDFWRVETIEENSLLLLRAEMRLPGLAWLEFRIDPAGEGENRLTVTAYYQSRGLWGRIYWYIFMPFHQFIFQDLIMEIEKRSC